MCLVKLECAKFCIYSTCRSMLNAEVRSTLGVASPEHCFIELEEVLPSCSLQLKRCLEDVVHVFMQSIIDLTLSLGSRSRWAQGPHTSLCFNVSSAMSSYTSPCSIIMTITSSTRATPVTVMPGLQNCPETWDQSRDWHHLGFIDLGSVIVGIGIFNFYTFSAPFRQQLFVFLVLFVKFSL